MVKSVVKTTSKQQMCVFPTSWKDLSLKDLHFYFKRLKSTSEEQILNDMFLYFLPKKIRIKSILRMFWLSTLAKSKIKIVSEQAQNSILEISENVSQITECFDFLKEPQTCFTNPFPTLCRGKFKGPKDALIDITLFQFFSIDTLLNSLNRDVKNDVLEIIAVLWKIPKKKLKKNIKDWQIDAVLMYFIGSFAHIAKIFPSLFKNDKKGSKSYNSSDFIIDLSGKIFGDYEKTKNTKLYDVLIYLQKTIKENYKKNDK